MGSRDGGVSTGILVSAGQGAVPPLPRRKPGTHGAKAAKTDPAPADQETLQKVIDGLNRM
jgi:hypothetical protein